MFSIIISTIREDVMALRPVFMTSSKDAEVIIIDSFYNEHTKKILQELEHCYNKVIYAPPKQRT